jgi:glycosyltransferase involved in cell wall biosynthesis
MNETKPVVSVVIPAYKHQYLEDAIRSVYGQTYKHYELIVVDDGSFCGGIAAICERYKGRLLYVRRENGGPSASRNTGIGKSRGEYVAFLDDDDLWMPDKLEKQIDLADTLKRNNINLGLIYTGQQMISETGEILANGLCKSGGYNYKLLLFGDFIGTCSSVMVKRSVFDDVGLFDESLICAQDYDLWLRIARNYEIYSVNEILVRYRNVPSSISKDPERGINDYSIILQKQLDADPEYLLIDEDTRILLKRHYKKISALRYKNSAYKYLFRAGDADLFRKYINKGFSIDRTYYGLKVLIYYIFSYLSPRLCKKLEMYKERSCKKDYIIDTKDPKYDWLRIIKGDRNILQ